MRIPLLVLATFAVASLQPCSAATRDHLIPQYGPEWKSYGNYRHLLRKKLGLAPYDCERIMIIPDLGPEGSVSVSSKSGQARVILLTPSKSFWQSRETHEHVEIIRTEHELPNETAARFKKACERLLGDIRPLKPLASNSAVRVVDGLPLFEIALQRATGAAISGDVPYSLSW